jgi:hypothetical protein
MVQEEQMDQWSTQSRNYTHVKKSTQKGLVNNLWTINIKKLKIVAILWQKF